MFKAKDIHIFYSSQIRFQRHADTDNLSGRLNILTSYTETHRPRYQNLVCRDNFVQESSAKRVKMAIVWLFDNIRPESYFKEIRFYLNFHMRFYSSDRSVLVFCPE